MSAICRSDALDDRILKGRCFTYSENGLDKIKTGYDPSLKSLVSSQGQEIAGYCCDSMEKSDEGNLLYDLRSHFTFLGMKPIVQYTTSDHRA